MDGFEESIADRTGSNEAQTPIVQIIAALNEDFDNTEGTRLAGVLKREVLLTSDVAMSVDYDQTVNTLGVDTVSAISFEDATEIRSAIRNALADEPYSVNEFAVQADIQVSRL